MEFVQVPSEHLFIDLSSQLVSWEGKSQFAFVNLQEPSLQRIGVLLGQWTKLGQSDKLFLQSPFPHLIGLNDGHST